jgi:hypothetical protein
VNSVNNDNLTKSVFVALLLVSTVVGAEDKYPASDFQPKVVFQDEAVAKEAESSGSTTKSAPAASTPAASGSTDSKYPAANFEPKVVYSDADYKHTAPSPSSASSAQGSNAAPESSAAGTATPAVVKDESSIGYMLGLIVLAVAGFVLFKKGTGTTTTAKASNTTRGQGGLTGVAKYVLRTSGTGVSRYLEKHGKSAAATSATGVAKYLAKASSTKATAGDAVTGVEKYMRNKG